MRHSGDRRGELASGQLLEPFERRSERFGVPTTSEEMHREQHEVGGPRVSSRYEPLECCEKLGGLGVDGLIALFPARGVVQDAGEPPLPGTSEGRLGGDRPHR